MPHFNHSKIKDKLMMKMISKFYIKLYQYWEVNCMRLELDGVALSFFGPSYPFLLGTFPAGLSITGIYILVLAAAIGLAITIFASNVPGHVADLISALHFFNYVVPSFGDDPNVVALWLLYLKMTGGG